MTNETQQNVNVPAGTTVPVKTVYVNGTASDRMILQAQENAARQAALYNELMPHYQQQLESGIASAKKQRASAKKSLKAQYQKQQAALKKNYQTTLASQKKDYNHSAGQVNTQADEKLREAWVSKMLQDKSLSQKLSARGLNGGVAETVALAAENAHTRSRNQLEQSRAEALAALLHEWQQSRAKTKSDYAAARAKNSASKTKALQAARTTYQKQIAQAKSAFSKSRAAALAKLYK